MIKANRDVKVNLAVYVKITSAIPENNSQYMVLVDENRMRSATEMKDMVYLITYMADCLSDAIQQVYTNTGLSPRFVYESGDAFYIYGESKK